MKAVLKVGLVVALCLMLSPVLVGAEPPQPKGQLVFQDDFSDPSKSGLEDNVNATDYSRGFHAPGVYHLRLDSNNDTRVSLMPQQTYQSFTVELDVWDNSDDFAGDVAQGLAFRAQDATHLYAVLLNPRKAQYAIRKLDGENNWTDIVAWKDSALIKQKADVNQLRVDAEGDQFTIYLQGETLDSFTDGSFAQGGIGMVASNVDAVKPHMHFDNIRVYSADAAAAPVEQAGTPGTTQLPQAGRDAGLLPWLALLGVIMLSAGTGLRRRAFKR